MTMSPGWLIVVGLFIMVVIPMVSIATLDRFDLDWLFALIMFVSLAGGGAMLAVGIQRSMDNEINNCYDSGRQWIKTGEQYMTLIDGVPYWHDEYECRGVDITEVVK